jgi:2-polyprenyl-3-methyl-5-hydroxy-6-metoxy-1,4-benzoquinol methylase
LTPVPPPVCLCGEPLRRLIADIDTGYSRGYFLYRCERCDLISPDPLPTESELTAQYRGYGQYAEAEYFKHDIARKRAQAERLLKKLGRLFGTGRKLRFLEVGCAAGALLSNLAERAELDVHGVEIDPFNAQVARQRLGERVRVGNLGDAGHAPHSFDVVYADQVIEHVPAANAFLATCLSVLKPGGVLLAATPNFDGLSARWLRLTWKEFVPTEHVRMFTPRALRFHLERMGFARVSVSTQGLSFIRNRDRRDLLRVPRGSLLGRALNKGVSVAGLADGLSAVAFKPNGAVS